MMLPKVPYSLHGDGHVVSKI